MKIQELRDDVLRYISSIRRRKKILIKLNRTKLNRTERFRLFAKHIKEATF